MTMPAVAAMNDARVLVASDNVEDARLVMRQLSVEFDQVRASIDPALLVQDFEAHRPDVLVLAFDALDKAQRYYLGLYRLGRASQWHPHRTVILCGKQDLRAVFELCKKDYFDDYVLYWPLSHDGPRLLMSVWAASRDRRKRDAKAISSAELLQHARHLNDLEHVLDQALPAGEPVAGAAGVELAAVDAGRRAWTREVRQQIEPALSDVCQLSARLGEIRPVILVVEDDEFTQELIRRSLDPNLFELAMVGDGPQALQWLTRQIPDLILMDIRLPGMDGLALTAQFKATPALALVPVIVMTGDARRETLQSSQAAGAAAFVVKPFTKDSLRLKLAKFVPR